MLSLDFFSSPFYPSKLIYHPLQVFVVYVDFANHTFTGDKSAGPVPISFGGNQSQQSEQGQQSPPRSSPPVNSRPPMTMPESGATEDDFDLQVKPSTFIHPPSYQRPISQGFALNRSNIATNHPSPSKSLYLISLYLSKSLKISRNLSKSL